MTTLKEIAAKLGVSESTVSRGLRDNPRIPVETRDRIKKLAKELDFEFNSNAQGLSTKRCRTIGVVYPDYENIYHNFLYLDLLINDIRHNIEKFDHDCLIFQATRSSDGASNIRRLVLQKKVDGFVFVVSNMCADDWALIEKHNVPIVQVHSVPLFFDAALRTSDFDFFFTDNHYGGLLATRHLLERGCRRILCLADIHAGPEMLERTQGYLDALSEVPQETIPPLILESQSDFDSVVRTIGSRLDDLASADGLFAHTDIMALAAVHVCRDAGIAIPDRIKIVGFDDIPMGGIMSPKLTTIHQPREAQAEQACAHLMQLIEHPERPPLRQCYLKPTLVVREST